MENISDYIGKELNWTLVKNVGYVLHAHDEQSGIAVLQVKGVYGSKAEGKYGSNIWNFKRAGLLQNNIEIQEGEHGRQLALFKRKKLGGILETNEGKKFTVKRNAWFTEYELLQENDLLIRYVYEQNRPQVFIQQAAENVPELPWLVLFSGYLVIMQRIDASQPFIP